MKVMKFGGSSIADVERINKVIEIVRSNIKDEAAVLVFSAFGGVTDDLVKVSKIASSGDLSYRDVLRSLQDRHIEIVKNLVPVHDQSTVLVQLKMWFNDLQDVLNGVSLVGELSVRCLDYVMSFGELFSTLIVSAAIRGAGIECDFLDAREVIKTDDNFGSAKVDFELSNKLLTEHFNNKKTLQVTTGFITSTAANDTITLGRGGSDYTAAILGAALKVSVIEIWTDVDGMMTADPRKVKKAFSQKNVKYEEAMELSHFGAKVIYPPTVQPALQHGIPIRVKNTFNPDYEGTTLDNSTETLGYAICGISSIAQVALLRLQGTGMVGVAGVSARLFGALSASQINVILITQASSEYSICLAVRPEDSQKAEDIINKEFIHEITNSYINPVIVEKNLAVISVVGANMRHTPGIAGRVFHCLGKNGTNIIAIAQGSSELNISAVISSSDEIKALNALHEEFFFPDTKSINLYIVGTGLIGSALLKQIREHSENLKELHEHEIKLIGLANSKKMHFNVAGIEVNNYKNKLAEGQDYDLSKFIAQIRNNNLKNSVFVDCTASADVTKHYLELLRSHISIVTPNKRAQTEAYKNYEQLMIAKKRRDVEFLYETSVGAGLPVISTLNDLLKSGDQIERIEAVLSGTLSFIFNSVGPGKLFSEIVKQAKANGYTEPDPRDDLNGMDVARKILILAREVGYKLEMNDVEIGSLVPEACRSCKTVEEFMQKLPEFDGEFEERRKKAAEYGKKLCYIASLEQGIAKVGIQEIDNGHPFYNLSGSDNIIAFTTKRYHDRPLVVKGPGAGAEVTAAGVFADIIRIAS